MLAMAEPQEVGRDTVLLQSGKNDESVVCGNQEGVLKVAAGEMDGRKSGGMR